MMTTLLFPGQGSQEPGMGGGLFDRFPKLVAQADEILGYSVEALCNDESDQLNQTCYTQPALFVVSCLSFEAWQEDSGHEISFAAGHSVGEYAALYAAGVIDFATGVQLVQKRGEIMQFQKGGGMAAVIGLQLSEVKQVLESCKFSGIDIANLNSPEQIIVSGLQSDIEKAEKSFLDNGAKRYIPLKVSGAFHSSYMKQPAEEFGAFLKCYKFTAPEFPVISNLEAKPYEFSRTGEILKQQIYSPVRWVETIQYLRMQGEMEFTELGSGRVLTGLLRRIR